MPVGADLSLTSDLSLAALPALAGDTCQVHCWVLLIRLRKSICKIARVQAEILELACVHRRKRGELCAMCPKPWQPQNGRSRYVQKDENAAGNTTLVASRPGPVWEFEGGHGVLPS